MALEILGQGGGGGIGRYKWLLVGGVAVAGFFLLRSRTSSSASGGAATDGASEDFARTALAAQNDMQKLVATNDMERYKLDLAQHNTPAGLQSTWTGEQWNALGKGVRQTVLSQAKRSGSLITAGPGGGLTITPTYRGIEGDLQSVQKSRTGLFSSGSSGIGTSAPSYGTPGIISLANAYFRGGLYY